MRTNLGLLAVGSTWFPFPEVAGNILTDLLLERNRSRKLDFRFTEFSEVPSDLAMLALLIPVRQAVEMLAAGTRSWHASWPLHGYRRGPRSKSPVRSARSSTTEAEEVPLGVSRRHGGCTLVGGRGLAVPPQPPKQIGSRGVERVVVVQVQLVHQGQRSSGALHLADGDGTVEGHDRRGGDRK